MTQNVNIREDLRDLGIQVKIDETADDSDKTLTVPAGEVWEVLAVHASLVSSATAGNRRMAVEAQDDSANVLARIQAAVEQAQGVTRGYNFAPGLADQTAFVNGDLNSALPELVLGPGHVLRIYDIAGVDAAVDDLSIYVTVRVGKAVS